MDLVYPLIALGLVTVALVALAGACLALAAWTRWVVARGGVALGALAVVAVAVVNVAVPRPCSDGEVRDRQRPLTAVVDSTGDCRRMGVANVALVPVAGVVATVVAARGRPSAAGRRPVAV